MPIMIPRRLAPALVLGVLALTACGTASDGAEEADPVADALDEISDRLGKLEGLESRIVLLEQKVAETATAEHEPETGAEEPGDSDGAEHEAAEHEAPHWGYADADHWGELAAEFATCGTGTEQSPIDLTRAVVAEIDDADLAYQASAATVTDNGHTVQVDFADGGTATVDGHEYALKQFHFHAPSEHTVDGEHSPVEAHFVHADADGALAVIGVMVVEGDANPLFDSILASIPATGEHAPLPAELDASELLPPRLMAYRYPGSLTTPPCSEGVTWSVLAEPISWSTDQVTALTSRLAEPNNRPVQPLNDRELRIDIAPG